MAKNPATLGLHLGPSLCFATLLAFSSPALADDAPPALPAELSSFPLAGKNVRLAKDAEGQILTYEVPYNRMTVWSKEGKRSKTCVFWPSQLTGRLGAVGFSEDRAIVNFRDDPERLVILDLSHCEVKERASLNDMMPVEFFAARGGWTVTGPRVPVGEYVLARLDLAGKLTEKFALPSEIKSDMQTRFPKLPFNRSVAISVDGDIWLVPGAVYSFSRPSQRGKEEHAFAPPVCLQAEARELVGDEQVKFHETRVDGAPAGEAKRLAQRAVEAARAGKSTTFLGALSAAASYGNLLGLLVRFDRESRRGCRLDIWDMTVEAPVAILPVGEECGGFLAFSDDAAWIAKGGMVQWRIPLVTRTRLSR